MSDRSLCGWHVRTALDLPELAPWAGEGSVPDIVVELGGLPARLADPVHETAALQIGADRSCLVAIAGIARFLVTASRVTVEPSVPLDSAALRGPLVGTLAGMLCHLRGRLPLHASVVGVGDGAIALAGPSGVGKSTLAAACARLGCRVLGDDLAVVDLPLGRPPVLRLGPATLKLARASLDALGLPVDRAVAPAYGAGKYLVPQPAGDGPVPLAAIYVLNDAGEGSPPGIQRLAPILAVRRLNREVYRRRLGEWLGRREALLAATLELVGLVPVIRVSRRRDLDGLAALAAAVVADARSRVAGQIPSVVPAFEPADEFSGVDAVR